MQPILSRRGTIRFSLRAYRGGSGHGDDSPEPMVTSPRISASWQMMERLPTLMLLAFGAVEAVEDVLDVRTVRLGACRPR